MGDQIQGETFHNLIVQISSIKKMAMGRDFANPCERLYYGQNLVQFVVFFTNNEQMFALIYLHLP